MQLYEHSALAFKPVNVPPQSKVSEKHRMRVDLRSTYWPKAGRVCETESSHEFDHMVLLHADPSVLACCPRPGPQINDWVGDEQLIYTPDAWVRRDASLEQFREVKPKKNLIESPDGVLEPKKWHLFRRWCATAGVACLFVTDEDLEQRRRLIDNWTQILPWVVQAIAENKPVLIDRLRELMHARDTPLCIGEVESHIPDESAESCVAAVCYLLQTHELTADLDGQIFSRSLVVRWA